MGCAGLQTPLFACSVSKRLLPPPALAASCLAIAAASSCCCAFSQASSRCVGSSSVPPLTKRDMFAAGSGGRVWRLVMHWSLVLKRRG
jgi:hypothetical protein